MDELRMLERADQFKDYSLFAQGCLWESSGEMRVSSPLRRVIADTLLSEWIRNQIPGMLEDEETCMGEETTEDESTA